MGKYNFLVSQTTRPIANSPPKTLEVKYTIFEHRIDFLRQNHIHLTRLQNSQYFCVFKYAQAVNEKVWNEAENRERDWGEKIRTVRFAYVIFQGVRS